MLQPTQLRTGVLDRGGGTRIRVLYKDKVLTARQTDIYHFNKSGKQHLEHILSARKGDAQAVAKLGALDKEAERYLLSSEAFRYNSVSFNLSNSKVCLHWEADQGQQLTGWRSIFGQTIHIFVTKSYLTSKYELAGCSPKWVIANTKEYIHRNYLAIAWQMMRHLGFVQSSSQGSSGEIRSRFIAMLQKNNIKSILDVGCGSPPSFLKLFLPIAREAGVELFGLDLEGIDPDHMIPGVELVKGEAQQIDDIFPGKKFDLIFSSGVLGRVMNHVYSADPEKAALDIVHNCLNALSDNPKSAMFNQSFFSFFNLDRTRINGQILHWNTDEMQQRAETNKTRAREFVEAYSSGDSDRAERLWYLWRQGANVVVIAK